MLTDNFDEGPWDTWCIEWAGSLAGKLFHPQLSTIRMWYGSLSAPESACELVECSCLLTPFVSPAQDAYSSMFSHQWWGHEAESNLHWACAQETFICVLLPGRIEEDIANVILIKLLLTHAVNIFRVFLS